MRFSAQLPMDIAPGRPAPGPELLSAAAVAEMARAAEAAGFDAGFVTDHPIPDDRFLASGGHHSLDPFVALAFAAAATERLRLQTHVLVLPYRNPFVSAKAAASLDVLSGGRVILGVASGYLEGEFAALGSPFDERNERTDEAIDVMRRVWREDGVAVEGRGFRAEGNTALPRPLQQPGPPIWVGGNSRRAIRRAVERGDGWLPFPAPARMARFIRTAALESADDLAARMDYVRAHAEKVGRTDPLDICAVPFGLEAYWRGDVSPGEMLDEVAALASVGVTWLALNVPCASRAEYGERVARLGEQVIAPWRRGGAAQR